MKQWIERKKDQNQVNQLMIELGMPKLIAKILAAREIIETAQVKKFLNTSFQDLPDPEKLSGMEAGCERLVRAIFNKEKIGIFGDYDVDGIASTVILSEFLEKIGINVAITLPNRLTEGYGLSATGIERLLKHNVDLIITVDCGTSNFLEIESIIEKNIDVLIIDHHSISSKLPNATAIINPHKIDCKSCAQHLCAAAVTFNFCMALRRRLREMRFFENKIEPNLIDLLDLVAIGTVADVVPLIKDNRVFVKKGMQVIKQAKRIGLKFLADVSNVDLSKVTSEMLGFYICPRINAIGRLGDALKAVELLRSTTSKDAQLLAAELNNTNRERKKIETQIFQEALMEINDSKEHKEAFINILGKKSWHPGVIGIVASRLTEKTGKPTVLIGENGRGSGRSLPGFHLYEALVSIKNTMIQFGGHSYAVGIKISWDKFEIFKESLRKYAQEKIRKIDLIPSLYYDSEILMDELTFELVKQLQIIAPFGRSNPEPVFCLRNIIVENSKVLNGEHLKGQIRSQKKGCDLIKFIAFGMFNKKKLLSNPVDILFVPEINQWLGRDFLQLRIKDFKASS